MNVESNEAPASVYGKDGMLDKMKCKERVDKERPCTTYKEGG